MAFRSVPHVPAAADGELSVQAAEALVRQVRQEARGGLLRGVLPRHQGMYLLAYILSYLKIQKMCKCVQAAHWGWVRLG